MNAKPDVSTRNTSPRCERERDYTLFCFLKSRTTILAHPDQIRKCFFWGLFLFLFQPLSADLCDDFFRAIKVVSPIIVYACQRRQSKVKTQITHLIFPSASLCFCSSLLQSSSNSHLRATNPSIPRRCTCCKHQSFSRNCTSFSSRH